MGTTILDVKVVGNCSKHGEIMKNKFGEPYSDDKIECVACMFKNSKTNGGEK